jgi:Amt family ammonium transporter
MAASGTRWLLRSAYRVFFMQLGFTFLEVGNAEVKNVQNIVTKNILDACISAMMWWIVGYSVAFGKSSGSNSVIGIGDYLLWGSDIDYATWVFQLQFVSSAATIFGGAVAGRTKFASYGMITMVTSSVVFPLAAHWVC